MYSMVNAFFLNEHSDSPSMFQKLASKKLIAHCDKRFEVERCTGIAWVQIPYGPEFFSGPIYNYLFQ